MSLLFESVYFQSDTAAAPMFRMLKSRGDIAVMDFLIDHHIEGLGQRSSAAHHSSGSSIIYKDQYIFAVNAERRTISLDYLDLSNHNSFNGYDDDAIWYDTKNGNFESSDVERYNCEAIVSTSIINGQRDQAAMQCKRYGMDYDLVIALHQQSLGVA